MGTDYAYSLVIICPENHLAAARALATALGHQPPHGATLSAPLSATGEAPATHYGAEMAARQGLVDLLEAGLAPDLDYAAVGSSKESVQAAVSALIWHAEPRETRSGGKHFAAVAEGAGLALIVEDDPFGGP